MLKLERFSFGVGDRFAHQAQSQLRAFEMIAADGVDVVPVWNKSNREHTFVGSEPPSVQAAAEAAVRARGWTRPWYVDADHINLTTVDRFLETSNFFTIDVADSIGKSPAGDAIAEFVKRHSELLRPIDLPGRDATLFIDEAFITAAAGKYLQAVQTAGLIYRHIAGRKGAENFVAEVSMDETDLPQSPAELLIILVAMADEKIPLQTIAPKFTGRFNKGVDYVGDLSQFEREFYDDLAVLQYAIQHYGLPDNLKLSVHSGSDKFSLYPIIRKAVRETGAGLHLKTAGTTWLEEVIGLSEAEGDGLELVKEIYAYALQHIDELCGPYASVIQIDPSQLPSEAETRKWSGNQFANAIRHIPSEPEFNPHMRQLLHVSFKLAAKAGSRYTNLLKANEAVIAKNVTENIYERHMVPLFLSGDSHSTLP